MGYLSWKQKRAFFKPKQKKAYTMVGLTLLSLIIFGGFAIRPAIVTIVELRKKIRDQEEVLEKLDTKIKNLSRAQTNLRKISSDLPLLEKALPKNSNSSQILENVYLRSQSSDLQVEYLYFENEKKFPQKYPNNTISVIKIPFSVDIEGSFPQFLGFLRGSQKSLRQKVIKEIDIGTKESGSAEKYKIGLETFYYNYE